MFWFIYLIFIFISHHVFLLHPLDKVVNKNWPGIHLTVVGFHIFHHRWELVYHVPKIFMAFSRLLRPQKVQIFLKLLQVHEIFFQEHRPKSLSKGKVHCETFNEECVKDPSVHFFKGPGILKLLFHFRQQLL